MVRGVSFRIPQTTGDILWQILKCINVEVFDWYNIGSQNETWSVENNVMSEAFFVEDHYNGKSFLQSIHSNYYIIFLKLQAYFEEGVFYDIHTYDEFHKSDCQLLLLINDCEFVEIYLKDQILVNSIRDNAIANNYSEVEYITESNDSRTKMDIL